MTDKLKKLIEDELKSAYTQGRAEAETEYYDALLIAKSKAYDQGLSEGKRINEKGCAGCEHILLDGSIYPCFGCKNNYPNLWKPEKKDDDKFEFGDEVIDEHGIKGIVVSKYNTGSEGLYVLFNGLSVPQNVSKRNHKKTGKHYALEKFMEELKG